MSSKNVLKCALGKEQKQAIRRTLWEKSRICGVCKKELPGIDKSTIDHIIPLSLGGVDGISNMQLVHSKCNHLKDSRIEVYFAKSQMKKRKYPGQLIDMINHELKKIGKCLTA